jgi:hypothetical protein
MPVPKLGSGVICVGAKQFFCRNFSGSAPKKIVFFCPQGRRKKFPLNQPPLPESRKLLDLPAIVQALVAEFLKCVPSKKTAIGKLKSIRCLPRAGPLFSFLIAFADLTSIQTKEAEKRQKTKRG